MSECRIEKLKTFSLDIVPNGTPPIAELEPLLRKVARLRASETTKDVAEQVEEWVAQARTPTMAQGVCDRVIANCHAKAWGDRQADGFGANAFEGWNEYLSELKQLAQQCGQAIFDRRES